MDAFLFGNAEFLLQREGLRADLLGRLRGLGDGEVHARPELAGRPPFGLLGEDVSGDSHGGSVLRVVEDALREPEHTVGEVVGLERARLLVQQLELGLGACPRQHLLRRGHPVDGADGLERLALCDSLADCLGEHAVVPDAGARGVVGGLGRQDAGEFRRCDTVDDGRRVNLVGAGVCRAAHAALAPD